MTQMTTAGTAEYLGAYHTVTAVQFLYYRARRGSLVKRGPSAPAIVLRAGFKQFGAAARTRVSACFEMKVVFARKRSLRALFSQYVVLLWGQFLFPVDVLWVHAEMVKLIRVKVNGTRRNVKG